jgi:hypothetical protein
MQIAHMTKMMPMHKINTKEQQRICWTDNFYTRRQLAAQLNDISDEIVLGGTVRSNFIDEVNKFFYDNAKVKFLEHAETGDWCLIPAFHPHPDHETDKANKKKWNEHVERELKRRMKSKDGKELGNKKKYTKYEERFRKMKDEELVKEEMVPSRSFQVPNAGYLLFYDNNVVSMYHSGLADTPKLDPVYSFGKFRLSKQSEISHAIKCLHGLGPFHRWSNNKMTDKTVYQVPSIVLAYNMFMNSVDVMDQIRSANITRRKERHLHMSMWTMVLDLAVHNGYAMYKWILDNHPKQIEIKDKIHSFREFKRQVAEGLVIPYMEQKQKKGQINRDGCHQSCILDYIESNKKRAQVACRLCSVFDKSVGKKVQKSSQTSYYCNSCNHGFHTTCFEFYHNLDKYPGVKEIMENDNLLHKMKPKKSMNSKYANGVIIYQFIES